VNTVGNRLTVGEMVRSASTTTSGIRTLRAGASSPPPRRLASISSSWVAGARRALPGSCSEAWRRRSSPTRRALCWWCD